MKKNIIIILAIAIAGMFNINNMFAEDPLVIKGNHGDDDELKDTYGPRLEGIINGVYDGNKVTLDFNDNAGTVTIGLNNQQTPLLVTEVNTNTQRVVELDVSSLNPGSYRIDFTNNEGSKAYTIIEIK